MTQAGYQRELDAARGAAREAGRAIMGYYGEGSWQLKGDASPVTVADHAANEVITRVLRAAFPGDALLSEESSDSPERLSASRVWIIDPLDGTKEFLAQNGEFSVLIGLVAEGEPVLGVAYLPAVNVLYSAARGMGAWVESGGERRRLELGEVMGGAGVRLVGSRSHADPFLLRLQAELGITDVAPCGSVGVKCARIAEGTRDLYVHPVGHLKEWDTCAPEVILREAGGFVTDCRGTPLAYNKPNPVQPYGILAAAPSVHALVREPIARLYADAFPVAGGVGAPNLDVGP